MGSFGFKHLNRFEVLEFMEESQAEQLVWFMLNVEKRGIKRDEMRRPKLKEWQKFDPKKDVFRFVREKHGGIK